MEQILNSFVNSLSIMLQPLRDLVEESLPEALGGLLAFLVIALGTALVRRRRKHNRDRNVRGNGGDENLELLRGYLEQVVVSNSTLVFGDPTRTSMDAATSPGVIVLSQVWTPLSVTTHTPSRHTTPHSPSVRQILGKDDEQLFVDAVESPGNRHLLLLGEPGSGKSTAMSYLAVESAKSALGSLKGLSWRENGLLRNIPVRVYLRDVLPSEEGTLLDLWTGVPELAVIKNTEEKNKVAKLVHLLQLLMREGKCIILMDGLDEVREELLPKVKQMIGLVFAAFSDSRIVVTCRTYDYFREAPNRRIPIQVIVRLLPFKMSDMCTYVRSWYDAVVRIGRLTADTAERLKDNLIKSLEAHPQLSYLGRTPLLLTLLTLVHTEEGELPESRALVYHRAIRYMLAETAQWRREAGGATVASGEMMDLAQHVAFVAHNELEKTGTTFRGLSLKQLAEIVASYFRLHEQPAGELYEKTNEKVSAHLARLIQSNGLLLDQGGNKYSFAHRSFQEFLAGQYFAPGSHHAEALAAAGEVHWREAFRLLAGYGARQGTNLYYLLALVDDLGQVERSHDLPKARNTDPILAGEMLLEIGRDSFVTSGYRRVLEINGPGSGPTGLWYRTCRTLIDLIDRNPPVLDVAERIRAAHAIGQLGDLRILDQSGNALPVTDRLVELPPLLFTIGSSAGVGKEDERPKRMFQFSEFSISRYLCTNTEFAEFVRDGGYQKQELWGTEEAKKWVTGEKVFLENVTRLWIETVAEYHAKELRDKEIAVEDLENEAEIRCRPRQEPFYWRNPRFNKPNQPVVGINWWEARAFCSWITAKGHTQGWLRADELLRLPTEFEWERSSKDKNNDRSYPWGNEWDQGKAHTRDDGLNLDEPTPVGVYPHGTWDGGPLDLSGNVWEWLENLKLPYDKSYDQLRGSLSSLEDRAIRGSSWYNVPYLARCNSRFVDRPYNLYYDVGFRVVKVPDTIGLLPPSVA